MPASRAPRTSSTRSCSTDPLRTLCPAPLRQQQARTRSALRGAFFMAVRALGNAWRNNGARWRGCVVRGAPSPASFVSPTPSVFLSSPLPCLCLTTPTLTTQPRPMPSVAHGDKQGGMRVPSRARTVPGGRSFTCTPRPRRSRRKGRPATAAACAAWPSRARWACWCRAAGVARAQRCGGVRQGRKALAMGIQRAAAQRAITRTTAGKIARALPLRHRRAAMSAAWLPTPARSPAGAAPGRWD